MGSLLVITLHTAQYCTAADSTAHRVSYTYLSGSDDPAGPLRKQDGQQVISVPEAKMEGKVRSLG